MPVTYRTHPSLQVICLFCASICMSSCLSTLDNIGYDIQDEHDASGDSLRDSAAIVEASSSTSVSFLFDYSCFFPIPNGKRTVNTRRIIFEPGIRKIPVTCSVHSGLGQNSAFYRRLFEVDLRDSGLYEVRLEGSRFDATTHCLIVVDVSTDTEVARSCDEPYLKDDPNAFCSMGVDWLC